MKIKLLYFFFAIFAVNANAQVISIIGSCSPAGNWATDIDMSTTDNITYTLNNVTLTSATDPATTGLKFRQDHDWVINWGSANFPSGTGTQNGANIMTVAGTYDIAFNKTNGTYTFIPSGFPSIGIWGPAVDSQNGFGGPDIDMTTTDGIIYTLSGFYFSSGTAYFRVNDDNFNTWGSVAFPIGTAVQGGPTIQVTGGEWFVTFNRNTGDYSFAYPSIGILGTALTGFLAEDIDLTTSDGFNYTIQNLTLTDGEVKFRKDNLWTTNWGAVDFPTGTGVQSGPNIPVIAGTYDVTFEKSVGSYSFTSTLGNNQYSVAQLKVFPNPTNTNWTILFTKTIEALELYDTLGKMIITSVPNAQQTQIDGSSLPQGVYYLKIKAGADFAVQKIIKN
jgi:hypothetical protein